MPDQTNQSFLALLTSTEQWLTDYFDGASGEEGRLRNSLVRYIRYCRRNPKKWQESAARLKSIEKIKKVTITLALLRYKRSSTR